MKKVFMLLILAALLLIVGFNGCPTGGTTTKKGLDFSLATGLDQLSYGKTVSVGETFSIQINIENYDKVPRGGEVCIRDDQDDIYGGISGKECTTFSVRAAEVIEEKKKGFFGGAAEGVQAGTATIYFPSSGEYSYSGGTQKAKLFVTLKYVQDSIIGAPGGVPVPEPTSEMLELEQEAAPISVSGVEKSVTKKEGAYKVSLSIQLSKEQQAKIFPPNFKKEDENYISFKAEMLPKILECEPEGTYSKEKLQQGLIEIKTKKYIKCFTLIGEEEQTSLPLAIRLNYGVELVKEFPFTIAAE